MADFVLDLITDSGTVNFPKADRFPAPAGVPASQIMSASEWNSIGQALVDVRKNVLSGTLHGYNTRYANPGSIPTITGFQKLTSDYTYMDTNGELTLHKKDNSEWKVVTTNYLNRTGINQVFAPSGTLHVYSDGADARYVILQQANVVSRKNTVEFLREVTNQRVFVGQSQNASDGWVPANAAIVEVNDGSTSRGVLHSPADGTRVTFGHSSTNPQMRIGVHTTTPSKKVDINGDLNVQQSSSFADVYVTGTLFARSISDARSISGSIQVTGSFSVGTILQQEKNNVINGNFKYWQRGLGPVVKSTATPSRTYFPDRWYAFTFLYGSSHTQFTYTRQSASLPATSGSLSGSDFCIRIKCDTATDSLTNSWGLIVQEIDRDLVKELRGKRVTLSAKLRTGNQFANSFITMYVRQFTGSVDPNLNLTNATNVYDLLPAAVDTDQGLTGSWRQFSYTSTGSVDPTAQGMQVWVAYQVANGHTGGPGDYVEIGEVMLTAGECIPSTFKICAVSDASELLTCQKYYEKTYNLETATGSVTVVGRYFTLSNNTYSHSETEQWRVGSHPRFAVRKRVNPTVTLYSVDFGTAGYWNDWGVGDVATFASNISQTGFELTCGEDPYTLSGDLFYGHWVADAEI